MVNGSIESIAVALDKDLAEIQDLSKKLIRSKKKWGRNFSVASIGKAHPNYSLARCQRVFKTIVSFREAAEERAMSELPEEVMKKAAVLTGETKYKATLDRTRDVLLKLLRNTEKYGAEDSYCKGSGATLKYTETPLRLSPGDRLLFSKMEELIQRKDFKAAAEFSGD
ncbi:MAG: hypothetical protein L7U87_07675 [Chlamydiales bacterium]|nr:hypothetical protein [Chlamydiales bacterium]